MPSFEYQITRHSAETFKELTFYCSESGECSLSEVPEDQIAVLQNILNENGMSGWELVQVSFGRDGLLCFWKKPKESGK